jgi:hypothetical protein
MAAIDIERDQIFAKLGLEQFLVSDVAGGDHGASIASIAAWTNGPSRLWHEAHIVYGDPMKRDCVLW